MFVFGKNTKKENSREENENDVDGDDDSVLDDNQNERKQYEENLKKPIDWNEGYYWIGKDYANTFKADFRECADFSTGKKSYLKKKIFEI